MINYNVSRQFSRLNDSALNIFAVELINSLTGNPAFPTPIVPLSQLAVLQSDFAGAIVASNNGGMLATAVKNAARIALLAALRRQADYVQGVARHDLTALLSSGFSAASLNRSQAQLPKPGILAILNERTRQLTLRVTPITNARGYQTRTRVGEADWQDRGVFPQARRLELTPLTPGTVYTIQVRAIGGSTGYSDWSNAASQMSL